jgi:hypothetical protein
VKNKPNPRTPPPLAIPQPPCPIPSASLPQSSTCLSSPCRRRAAAAATPEMGGDGRGHAGDGRAATAAAMPAMERPRRRRTDSDGRVARATGAISSSTSRPPQACCRETAGDGRRVRRWQPPAGQKLEGSYRDVDLPGSSQVSKLLSTFPIFLLTSPLLISYIKLLFLCLCRFLLIYAYEESDGTTSRCSVPLNV